MMELYMFLMAYGITFISLFLLVLLGKDIRFLVGVLISVAVGIVVATTVHYTPMVISTFETTPIECEGNPKC